MNKHSTQQPHIVVVGGGFAGLTLAKRLRRSPFRVTLIDKNNYHQFAPLFYQVAAAQLEPSTILFPLRKEIKPYPKQAFLMATVEGVDTDNRVLKTNVGDIGYDYLVLAMGADTHYYGMENVKRNAYPMKSVSETLAIRNHILEMLEQAVVCTDMEERSRKLCITIVGGGPTGVEVAGAIGEMKRYVIPRDYPEIKVDEFRIVLVEGTARLLSAMSIKSFHSAARYLNELGVEVLLEKHVSDYDGETVTLSDGTTIKSDTMIWGSGISACSISGIDSAQLGRGGRLKVNELNQVQGYNNIFAIGDICLQTEEAYPNGHPQVAQVAIQQAVCLAKNFKRLGKHKKTKTFHYTDKGSMAIVGRNRAVTDIGWLHVGGFFAWLIWLFIHLFSLIGFKNKVFIVLDWAFSYFAHDASLRLIIRPKIKERK